MTTTVTPLERNRVAINFTIDEGEVAKIRQIHIVGTQAFPEATLLKQMQLSHPGLAHLVHQERPVFEAEARRRPGDAALLLHQPRLPGLQRRFDPGVDHPRQEGHLHHDQHHRRPKYTHRRDPAGRRAAAAGSRAERADPGQAGRHVLARKLNAVAKAITDRLAATATPSPTSTRCPNRQGRSARRPSPSSSIPGAASTCAGSTSAATPRRATK